MQRLCQQSQVRWPYLCAVRDLWQGTSCMHCWFLLEDSKASLSILFPNALGGRQFQGWPKKLGHRRIHSGGSDSSTGSTTSMDSDLDSADEETTVEKVRTSLGKKKTARIFIAETCVYSSESKWKRMNCPNLELALYESLGSRRLDWMRDWGKTRFGL